MTRESTECEQHQMQKMLKVTARRWKTKSRKRKEREEKGDERERKGEGAQRRRMSRTEEKEHRRKMI